MSHRRLAEIEISRIRTNPYQPRKHFDEDHIRELADSIAQVGLIQPILVRPSGDFFEVIAGERRLRACRDLGLEAISAVVVDVDPSEQQVMAMVENIHRKDLSSVEEAWGLRDILERTGWGQSELARRLGRSQASVANKLRLLKLEESVQKMIMEGILVERTARSLVGLSPALQLSAAKMIVERELASKEAEALVASIKDGSFRDDPEGSEPIEVCEEQLQCLDSGSEAEGELPSDGSTRRNRGTRGLSFNGPEGPTGELLHQLASLVEAQRKRGVPVVWKVRELAQSELVVEIVVDLKEHMMEGERE